MKTVIEYIQDEDPSYDPLTPALEKAGVTKELWNAATDRVYFDGYYGPINPVEWEEQDGREPYFVSEALTIIAKVLEEVDDYRDEDKLVLADAYEIKSALVAPWYNEIYGTRYPS